MNDNVERELKGIIANAIQLESNVKTILSRLETSRSRTITLETSYSTLTELSVKQDDLFRQAFRCVEVGCFRAAHVMAWAAFMDFLEEKLAKDRFKKLKSVRPRWKIKDIEQLREAVSEYQIIESLKDIGICTKNQVKALKGLLSRRNECAHPTDYYPGLNETLGFVSEILQRIRMIQSSRSKII